MELLIEQALQRGVTAHREGRIEEAEQLYRAILESEPTHPHACHNLGVLVMSLGNTEAALPLFKSALDTTPANQQFWLSYISALIKAKNFDKAETVLAQAKDQGIEGGKLNALADLISGNNKKAGLAGEEPSQELLDKLLGHYKNRRLKDAEQLSLKVTQDFPDHQFAWRILGAVLGVTGRKSEALIANQKVVELSPKDASAHSNLGVILRGLERFEEALNSYSQAIALNPNFIEAHVNLGLTLKELNRLDEAQASYQKAITLNPRYAEAYNYLGITLVALEKFKEAEAAYTKAIELKPSFYAAHSNLGDMLQKVGRSAEAISHYDLGGATAVCKSLECLYLNNEFSE